MAAVAEAAAAVAEAAAAAAEAAVEGAEGGAPARHVMLLDMGAASTNVGLIAVDAEPGQQLVSESGDAQLGCADFDAAVWAHFASHCKTLHKIEVTRSSRLTPTSTPTPTPTQTLPYPQTDPNSNPNPNPNPNPQFQLKPLPQPGVAQQPRRPAPPRRVQEGARAALDAAAGAVTVWYGGCNRT